MNHKTHTAKSAEALKGQSAKGEEGKPADAAARMSIGEEVDRRTTALHMALDLHRGKDKPADKIVEEAEVFDKFLRGGPDPDAEGR